MAGDRDDPALATFLAWQEPFPPDLVRAHEDMRDGAVGLLDRIGPSVLLTHSFGGAFGWFALSERPHLVKALVAIETAGPPFVKHPVLGDFTYGLTAVPVSYGPGSGDAKLGGIPVAVVSSPWSRMESWCWRRGTATRISRPILRLTLSARCFVRGRFQSCSRGLRSCQWWSKASSTSIAM